MKRKQMLCALSLSLAMLVTLTGCIIIPIPKRYEIALEDVSSIDIYDLRDCDYYYPSEETLVYTIEEDQMEDFLQDLSDVPFTDIIIIVLAAIDPSFNYGDWTVRINYTDGSYTYISCGGYGTTHDADGSLIDSNHYSCDTDEWEAFIEKYVPEDIFYAQE